MMKRYTIALLATLLAIGPANAQTSDDEVIFAAMQAELTRNTDSLTLAGAAQRTPDGKPFWTGYIYSLHRAMAVSATLGGVVSSQFVPYRTRAVRLLVGDATTTSDLVYDGSYAIRSAGSESDAANIRREFWLSSDAAYKEAAQDLVRKYAVLEQLNPSDEEAGLADFVAVQPLEKVVEGPRFDFDKGAWEALAEHLSAIFAEFPSLYSSRVWLGAHERTDYVLTSEGVKMRLPTTFASMTAAATVRTPDGEKFSDGIDVWAPSDRDLPSQNELAEKVRGFARRMAEWAVAPKLERFYSGPVLFVGQAAFNLFDDALLATDGGGLIVKRKPAGVEGILPAARLEKRIGQRVLDRRIGVINHTSAMRTWEGTPLMGYHEMGADGIMPEPSRTLIEGGVVRSLLGGRIPTVGDGAHKTDYSSRLSVDVDPCIAPGTLEITASQSSPMAELERRLVELARGDGLDSAYIVERRSGTDIVWRVDVSTGGRTLVRGTDVMHIALGRLKRVAGISTEREMRNYLAGQVPASMIHPCGVLLEDVEIGVSEVERKKPSPVDNPLMRK